MMSNSSEVVSKGKKVWIGEWGGNCSNENRLLTTQVTIGLGLFSS